MTDRDRRAIEQDRARPAPGEEELMRLHKRVLAETGWECSTDSPPALKEADAALRAAIRQALRQPRKVGVHDVAEFYKDDEPEATSMRNENYTQDGKDTEISPSAEITPKVNAQRWTNLYRAANAMIAKLGYEGSIDSRDPLTCALLDALQDIDDWSGPDTEISPSAEITPEATDAINQIEAFLSDAPKGKPHTGYRYGELLALAAALLRKAYLT